MRNTGARTWCTVVWSGPNRHIYRIFFISGTVWTERHMIYGDVSEHLRLEGKPQASCYGLLGLSKWLLKVSVGLHQISFQHPHRSVNACNRLKDMQRIERQTCKALSFFMTLNSQRLLSCRNTTHVNIVRRVSDKCVKSSKMHVIYLNDSSALATLPVF